MLEAIEETVKALAMVAVPLAQCDSEAPTNSMLGTDAVLMRGTPLVQVAVT